MICPQCLNGFLIQDSFNPLKSLVLSYRGYSKQVASQVLRQCTNCSYEVVEPVKGIDVDSEWVIFKREVNKLIVMEQI
jgi:hypothetical protein